MDAHFRSVNNCFGSLAVFLLTCMSDVTRILSKIESGDPTAAEKLLPLVYDELRKLAAAKLALEKSGADVAGKGAGRRVAVRRTG